MNPNRSNRRVHSSEFKAQILGTCKEPDASVAAVAIAQGLALPCMGVGMVELEVPLLILFVTFQAMKRSGHVWPIVSEDVQDRCMQRLTARARFNEGLPVDLADQMVRQFCDEHPERYLLAFVYGYLGDHDLLRVRTVAEKFLLLAALNLVECVAFAGAQTSS